MKYMDYAATTPPHPEVARTIAEVMNLHYGNPSSLHILGEQSEQLLKKAREVCAGALQVKPSEIIITSGASESNNAAIKGAALQFMNRGKHLITTATEHPSVYECCKQLERFGWNVTYLSVNHEGTVTPEQVCAAVQDDTVLVSIMHVNNETGSINPVQEVGMQLKEQYPRVLFHVDGVQGFGKLPLSLQASGIDMYSLSAHKFRGPKGIGLLYVREGIKLEPLLAGGSQEGGRRAGTENIPYVVGMAKALRLAKEEQAQVAERLRYLRKVLIDGIAAIPKLVLNSPPDGAPHIIHFSCPGMKAEAMLHMLEEDGFLVSTRSACSSKKSEPSRILLAMGKTVEEASSGIRVSLGEEHTEQDIQQFLAALQSAVARQEDLKGRG